MENASQWKDVFKEALQVAVILVLLDRLGFVEAENWLEAHADTLSVQAALIGGAGTTGLAAARRFMEHTARVEVK